MAHKPMKARLNPPRTAQDIEQAAVFELGNRLGYAVTPAEPVGDGTFRFVQVVHCDDNSSLEVATGISWVLNDQ